MQEFFVFIHYVKNNHTISLLNEINWYIYFEI